VNPKWIAGLNNELKYKWLTASVLFDARVGGVIGSISNRYGNEGGTLASSMYGREFDWNSPGIVGKGIDAATGKPNTIVVTAQDWFYGVSQRAPSLNIFDATYVKMRELRLTADLPPNVVNRLTRARALSLSLVGRNLATWARLPNFDPEFAYTAGNQQGIEYGTIPNPRSIGLNIRLTP
jgi:hypothetical protein